MFSLIMINLPEIHSGSSSRSSAKGRIIYFHYNSIHTYLTESFQNISKHIKITCSLIESLHKYALLFCLIIVMSTCSISLHSFVTHIIFTTGVVQWCPWYKQGLKAPKIESMHESEIVNKSRPNVGAIFTYELC